MVAMSPREYASYALRIRSTFSFDIGFLRDGLAHLKRLPPGRQLGAERDPPQESERARARVRRVAACPQWRLGQGWDPEVLNDPRVVKYWDPSEAVSLWFGQHVTHSQGIVWDHYILFGPDAT